MSLRLQHARSQMAGFVAALGMFAEAACSVTPLAATESGIAQARAKSPPGADAFDRYCASCHGPRGEGLSGAPAIIGSGALPKYPRDDPTSMINPLYATGANVQQDPTRVAGQARRGAFVTAQDVYDYLSTRMPLPKSSAGTLRPEEYWAIVNYLLIAHGVAVPSAGLTEANAKTVSIQP